MFALIYLRLEWYNLPLHFLLNTSVHITSFKYFPIHDHNFGEILHISVTSLISVQTRMHVSHQFFFKADLTKTADEINNEITGFMWDATNTIRCLAIFFYTKKDGNRN